MLGVLYPMCNVQTAGKGVSAYDFNPDSQSHTERPTDSQPTPEEMQAPRRSTSGSRPSCLC